MTITDSNGLLHYAIGYLGELLNPGAVCALTPTERIAHAHAFVMKLKQATDDMKSGGTVEL